MPKINAKFLIVYGKHTISIQSNSNAYIFMAGIHNNIHKKYGLSALYKYVSFVQDCYVSNDKQPPLGALADYIAKHWKKLKNKSRYDVLEKFYEKEMF